MDVCQHLLQGTKQCLRCNRYICPLCKSIYLVDYCNDCVAQEMISEIIANIQQLLRI